MIYVVALTGGIGSGKSVISNLFMKFGVTIIDSDIISRKIVSPGTVALRAIVDHFGTEIINKNGTLNRRLLREQIFSYPSEIKWLNGLLHPLIYQETQSQIVRATSPYVLWVVPLLVENQLYKKVNRVLVVDAVLETQIHRTMIRDNVPYKNIEQILSSQATREERLAIADDIIDNNKNTLDSIIINVAHLHEKYFILSMQRNLFTKKL